MASYRDLPTILRNLLASLTLLALVCAGPAAAAALKNTTITVPDGASDHGDPNLLCMPTKWTDIVIFYLGNYVAHAATVITLPGESAVSTSVTALIALFLPTSGVLRGVSAILICAKRGSTALQTAQRAQALCMLVRTPYWKPQIGDSVSNCILKLTAAPLSPSAVLSVYQAPWSGTSLEPVPLSSAIHGSFRLPRDGSYQFVLVPNDANLILPPIAEDEVNSEIACNYNALKGLVALGQSIYAITTLYSTRGDQIARFGYAAFGLTVAPYAIMSLINLIGGMMTPQYPCIYMVGSSIMDEAQNRPDCYFQGTVGRLAEVESERSQDLESEEGHFRLVNRPILFEQVDDTPLSARVYISTNLERDMLQPGQSDSSQDRIADIELGEFEHQEESVVLQIENEHQRLATPPQGNQDNEEVADGTDRARLIPQTTPNHASPSETVLFVPDSSQTRLHFGRTGHSSSRILSTASRETQFDEKRAAALFEVRRNEHDSITYACAIILGYIPLIIIGSLSHTFRKGKSTVAQRGWTMSWWVFGYVYGAAPAAPAISAMKNDFDGAHTTRERLTLLVFAAPAIGGFVVVGQMLASYGTCVRIS